MTPEEFFNILKAMPEPEPVLYRLYYDSEGRPITYSMDALPGNYIDIDHATYSTAPAHVRVVKGKLEILDTSVAIKLKPGESGTACDPRDVCVIVDDTQPHIKWSLK